MSAAFLWVLSHPQVEKPLKRYWAEIYPSLKFSYSKKNFMTFRDDRIRSEGEESKPLDSFFSKIIAHSIGKIDLEQLQSIEQKIKIFDRVDCFDFFSIEDVDANVSSDEKIQQYLSLSLGMKRQFKTHHGLCIVHLGGQEYWMGITDAQLMASPTIFFNQQSDRLVPSRAYYKVNEAISYFALDRYFNKNDLAIEFGASPGGAVLALLERGLRVVGVDPAQMSPMLNSFGDQFRHLKCQALQIDPADLTDLRLIFSDMNLPYSDVFRAVKKVKNDSIRAGVLTIKLKDWNVFSRHFLLQIEKDFQKIGFGQQMSLGFALLPHHRTEFCLAFWRQKKN